MIDAAIDQYAVTNSKKDNDPVTWADVQPFLKQGTKLYSSEGKDMFGNPFGISRIDAIPKVARQTYDKLSDVAPIEFSSPFY
jgi:hypothetical protein